MNRKQVTITINSTHRIRKTSVQSEPNLSTVKTKTSILTNRKCIDKQITNKTKDGKKVIDKEKLAKLKREYKEDISKAKRAKYNSASVSAQRVFKDLKNSASRGLTSFKTSFDNLLSLKLRLTKDGHQKSDYDKSCSNYNELENEPRTPVKLYSPFTIESPEIKERIFGHSYRRRRMRISQSINEDMILASPTGKIRDDIRSVTNSLNELCIISNDIQYKYSLTNSYSSFSITTQ